MKTIWSKLADWCLKEVNWHDAFRIPFVMRGPAIYDSLTVIAGSFQVSTQLLADPGWPSATARAWPSLQEIINREMSRMVGSYNANNGPFRGGTFR